MGNKISNLPPINVVGELTDSDLVPVVNTSPSAVTKKLTLLLLAAFLKVKNGIKFQDEGADVGTPGQFSIVNFTGGASLTDDGTTLTVAIAGSAQPNGQVVYGTGTGTTSDDSLTWNGSRLLIAPDADGSIRVRPAAGTAQVQVQSVDDSASFQFLSNDENALTMSAGIVGQASFTWEPAPGTADPRVMLRSSNADTGHNTDLFVAGGHVRVPQSVAADLVSFNNGGMYYDTTDAVFKFRQGGSTVTYANNANVVHLTGAENIAGAKTFTDALMVRNILTTGTASDNATSTVKSNNRSAALILDSFTGNNSSLVFYENGAERGRILGEANAIRFRNATGDVVRLDTTAAAPRFQADFNNATHANRLAFQASTTNADTAVPVIPNGTSQVARLHVFNSSAMTNCALGSVNVDASAVTFGSTVIGSGTLLPMVFTVGTELARLTTAGSLGVGTTTPGYAGWSKVVTVEGATNAGFELSTLRADVDGGSIGGLDYFFQSNATNHKRVASISGWSTGATANQRGGRLLFQVKANGATAMTDVFDVLVATGPRFRAKFDDGVVANRLLFQTTGANTYTSLGVIPSGTAQASYVQMFNRADPDNAAVAALYADNASVSVVSAAAGTGTLLPMAFQVGTERMRITTSGGLLIGTASTLAGDAAGRTQILTNSGGAPLVLRNNGNTAGNLWTVGPVAGGTFNIANASDVGVYLSYGGTSWTALSDERLKADLAPINGEDLWDWFKTVRTENGRYKTDEAGTERAFLIAQDWTERMDVVSENGETGMLGLASTNTLPYAYAVLKAAMARIEALEARIEELEIQ